MRLWRSRPEPAVVTNPELDHKPRRLVQHDPNMPAGDALRIRRKSPGIQSLFNRLADSTGLNILDLGMLSQRTPALVCSLGHSIYNASLLHSFDAARAANPSNETGMERQAASEFVRNHLDFRPDTFHGVLAWDVLQHLDKAAMLSTIAHLAKILRPDGTMLCLFHRKSTVATIPVLNCDVDSTSTFWIKETDHRESSREFSVRELESLFPQFQGIHFYLMQDSLHEVLVLN